MTIQISIYYHSISNSASYNVQQNYFDELVISPREYSKLNLHPIYDKMIYLLWLLTNPTQLYWCHRAKMIDISINVQVPPKSAKVPSRNFVEACRTRILIYSPVT
jgi:hypothetical protein